MKSNCRLLHITRSLKRLSPFSQAALLLFFVIGFGVSGCGAGNVYESEENEEKESGIVGTGLLLEGTINDPLFANITVVEAYSSDGKREVITINSDRSFNTDELIGQAPWLIRVQVTSDKSLYGIAYSDGTRNINAFSDVGLRRSLAKKNLDPNDLIGSPAIAASLPSSADYDESVQSITQLIDLVLQSYGITGMDIISTAYLTNNTGVDAFLRSNTVVIENGLITFQVTDPINGTTAETRSQTALTSDFVDSGAAPSQPGNIRVFAGVSNEIVLTWEPSVDDVSVAGYVVYRDEVIMGTTPYPQFIDTDVQSSSNYSYVIVALDNAGNVSEPSIATIGSTVQQVPTSEVPGQPSQLSLVSASNSSIRLSWSEPLDNNAASYKLYRGAQNQPPVFLQRVSITSALDAAVATSETYCYQVAAVNVNGQESSRSETLCVEARTEDNSGSPTELISAWNVPNTDVTCTNSLNTSDIALGQNTLASGCYLVPQTLTVAKGATLNIGIDTILKFAEGESLIVEGTLTVLGSRESPVLFTGMREERGYWGGVQFEGTSSTGNILRGAVVQFGGGGNSNIYGAVSTRYSGARVSMDDTLVQFNQIEAFSFASGEVTVGSFDGNLIYANDFAGDVSALAAHQLAGSTQYIENEDNTISLRGINFNNNDIVIPALGVPTETPGLNIENGSLTILPGTDLEIVPGGILNVDGAVSIAGEPDRPIIIRARNAEYQGAWDGIRLRGSGDKIIKHVIIRSAGASGNESGAVEIDCTNDSDITVQIDNTDISGSSGWGIYYKDGGCEIEIGSSVTYSNNDAGDTNVP